MGKNKKAVILLSGGIDSAAALFLARKKGYACTCLIFDYGQRHRKEIGFAKRLARHTGSKYDVVRIKLPSAGSSLLDRKRKIPAHSSVSRIGRSVPSTYVPARNVIFLSFAVSYAETLDAGAVFIGAHTQDYSGYPDCRPLFLKAFNKAARLGTKKTTKIRITAPFIGKKKKDIVMAAAKLGVPFGMTWSCYRGGRRPCGACDSCLYRKKGFEEAGLADR